VVLNATFNNISAISWRSVLFMKEARDPEENKLPKEGICVYVVMHV